MDDRRPEAIRAYQDLVAAMRTRGAKRPTSERGGLDAEAAWRAANLAASRIVRARNDPNVAMEYFMRDEETDLPLVQAPIHREWQRLVSAHRNNVIWSAPGMGKTSQLAVGRVLWELGRDPTLRVGIVSITADLAQKSVESIKGYIEKSEALRSLFPRLRPGRVWTSERISVERPATIRHPSVSAIGVGTKIQGFRFDLVISDDVLTWDTTRTPHRRKEAHDWFMGTLPSRLTPRARQIFLANAFHPEDLAHQLEKRPIWKSSRFPVMDEGGNLTWPERFTREIVEGKRAELTPLEFARQYLCRPYDEGQARFQRSWLEACKERGKGRRLLERLKVPPPGCAVFTGVDLGVGQTEEHDETIVFTILVWPGEDGRTGAGDRELIAIEAGRWTAPEIIRRIRSACRRFGSIAMVENVAAQRYIQQMLAASGDVVPVAGFTTGRNKADPTFGVESLASEMEQERWIIPCEADGTCHPQVQKWIDEMVYYSPTSHTGDRLMAAWFARELARRVAARATGSRASVHVIG